jgi:hypothetical protein
MKNMFLRRYHHKRNLKPALLVRVVCARETDDPLVSRERYV